MAIDTQRIPVLNHGVKVPWPCLILLCFLPLSACRPSASEGYRSSPLNFKYIFEAADVRLVDLRFSNARINLVQIPGKNIEISGSVRVRSSDQAAAEIKVQAFELTITQGHFTIIAPPKPAKGFSYELNIEVALPKGVSVRASLSEGNISGDLELPLMTDLQVGRGDVELNLPPESSAFINAAINLGSEDSFSLEDFDRVTGEPVQQMTRIEFRGAVGLPLEVVGSRLDIRINRGAIRVQGVK